MGKSQRDKGKVGEREWATYQRENHGLPDARRGKQYRGNEDAPDVVGSWPGTFAEVKRCERVEIVKWMAEAIEDAGDLVPYVAFRRNRGEWLVTIRASDVGRFTHAVNAAERQE